MIDVFELAFLSEIFSFKLKSSVLFNSFCSTRKALKNRGFSTENFVKENLYYSILHVYYL